MAAILHRNGTIRLSQRPLHGHDIHPAAKFQPDSPHHANLAKAQRQMQTDRADILAIPNHRNHLPKAAPRRMIQQRRHQGLAHALAAHIIADINAVLDGEAIGAAADADA